MPLVELRTTHHLRFVSDNAGVIAFDSAELMDREVWFHVIGHGYGVAKDGFGFEGVRVTPREGRDDCGEGATPFPCEAIGTHHRGRFVCGKSETGNELGWKESGVFGCDKCSKRCAQRAAVLELG